MAPQGSHISVVLGDAARSYTVTLALQNLGFNSELIAYCDDKDGLRKVPVGLSQDLEQYLGYPVSSIPDPFGCHESYGKHMSSLLLESLDKCGIEYRYFSAKEVYEKGLLLNEIRTILLNAKKVGEIVKEEVGQERYTEVLPFFPVCSNCGRIYTTKAYKFEPETDKVLYKCEGLGNPRQTHRRLRARRRSRYIERRGKTYLERRVRGSMESVGYTF